MKMTVLFAPGPRVGKGVVGRVDAGVVEGVVPVGPLVGRGGRSGQLGHNAKIGSS